MHSTPTQRSIEWVKNNIKDPRFVMHEIGVAAFDGEVKFNPPENPDHVSHEILECESTQANAIRVKVKRLVSIMKELGHGKIDLIKLDIEGAEYEVIDVLLKSNILPKQLLVEFHHRFPKVGIEKSIGTIKRLRDVGYKILSISETNEEYCFIREE